MLTGAIAGIDPEEMIRLGVFISSLALAIFAVVGWRLDRASAQYEVFLVEAAKGNRISDDQHVTLLAGLISPKKEDTEAGGDLASIFTDTTIRKDIREGFEVLWHRVRKLTLFRNVSIALFVWGAILQGAALIPILLQ